MYLQTITYTHANGSSTVLLSSPISIFIDSTITQFYLPSIVCDAFEKTFGLVWNSTSNLYLIDDQNHQKMKINNPSVTFTIAESEVGGPAVEITLPYMGFELDAKSTVAGNSTRYFPLRKADNETQYTLGRTFLQEACVFPTLRWGFERLINCFQLFNH